MAAASQLHQSEMKDLLMGFIGLLNTGGEVSEACTLPTRPHMSSGVDCLLMVL